MDLPTNITALIAFVAIFGAGFAAAWPWAYWEGKRAALKAAGQHEAAEGV